jgi:hypothetical protein
MINFTRAFDSAWERMLIILFQPFDLGKWCAVGFSAFLAGFLQGGNGFTSRFDYRYNFNNGWNTSQAAQMQKIHDQAMALFAHWQSGTFLLVTLVGFAVGLALALLFIWLGARGQFLLLDNVVRNRGAIAWPWHNYSRQGNSLFLFYLAVFLISLAFIIPILIALAVLAIPLFRQDRWPVGGEIIGFAGLGFVYFVLTVIMTFVLFVFREFGIPLMFRQGLLARRAFWASMNLIRQHPGSVLLFVLLRIAIFIGVVILSVIICCCTCCIGMVPYIGTVILLPVLIYVKCFTLDCLAQFGPEYDVWTVDVPAASPDAPVPPLSHPPLPG